MGWTSNHYHDVTGSGTHPVVFVCHLLGAGSWSLISI